MDTTQPPLFGDSLRQVADLLDRCTNHTGALKPEIRARIFAVLDVPTEANWLGARAAIVRGPLTTLWQAVTKNAGIPTDATPTRAQIIHALTVVTKATVAGSDNR